MRYQWEPANNSYSILEMLVIALKVLGVLIVIGGVIFGIAIAADSESGDEDAYRAGAAIGAVVASLVYGSLVAATGAAIDVFLGMASDVSGTRGDVAAGRASAERQERAAAKAAE